MRNVDLTRNLILRHINRIRILLSSFPEPDVEAIGRLQGADGVKRQAAIVDFFMEQLGHPPPSVDACGHSPTIKAARKYRADGV